MNRHAFAPDDSGLSCAVKDARGVECGLPENHDRHAIVPVETDAPDVPAKPPTALTDMLYALPPTMSMNTPLGEVVAWLRENLNSGVNCPACTQLAKVYRRKINSGMAHALIEMYRHARREWFYLPDITDRWQGRDEAGLRYWGLTEEASEPRPDGGRAGWWRVTEEGERYVNSLLRMPKYAQVYDGRCLGLEGEPVSIREALGSKFNYDELMLGI